MQKPTEFDISFKYICEQCQASHWLFYREVQTIDFKVVCECGKIFYPQIIQNIDIVYVDNSLRPSESPELDIVEQSIRMMSTLGYSKKESMEMIKQSLSKTNFDTYKDLVKYSLKHFGAEYV
jgi:hypothetical protein